MEDKIKGYFQRRIHESWIPVLKPVLPKIYETLASIFNTYPEKDAGYRCRIEKNRGVHLFPKPNDVLRAFRTTSFNDLRVVIVGQDPYLKNRLATGLAFGIPEGMQIPPSLQVIFREIDLTRAGKYDDTSLTHQEKLDYMKKMKDKQPWITQEMIDDAEAFLKELKEIPSYKDPTLESWAKQGVLLLNSSLTVEEDAPGSHYELWKKVMPEVYKLIAESKKDIIFVAIGNVARESTADLFGRESLFVVNHPAHDVRTGQNRFVGSEIFNKINLTLTKELKQKPINW